MGVMCRRVYLCEFLWSTAHVSVTALLPLEMELPATDNLAKGNFPGASTEHGGGFEGWY